MDMNPASQQSKGLATYLSGGERLLWSGAPKQGVMLTVKDALMIPFSILWGGFAIFWNAMVWIMPGENWFFRLWGLPFLIVGLYLIFGRFLHDALIRKQLTYGVTNQRILIARGSRLTSLDITRLPRLELSHGRDGAGTIAFEASSPFAMNGFGWWLPSLAGQARFVQIKDARAVYDLIRAQDTNRF